MSSVESEMSVEAGESPVREKKVSPASLGSSRTPSPAPLKHENGIHDQNGTIDLSKTPSYPERKRRASDELSVSSSTKATSEIMEDGSKDDDDNDEDEDDDNIKSSDYDPERLKSFNMFVRLFVDENLDRSVPISKQPKDKVQAILEACHRQFPEFQERSRKRIRTYLKSCRRMRRTKDQNGVEQLRPTPPHLTSAAAEGILAQACENESQNAKRMRMGLEPIAMSAIPTCPPTNSTSQSTTSSQSQSATPQPTPPKRQPSPTPVPTPASDLLRHAPPTAFRPPHEIQPFFTNGNGIFRPGFPGYQHPAHHPAAVLQASALTSTVPNGPADLSLKAKGSSKSQLNTTEVATVKQLISGYRESAAFLYRSADELEQLLLQNN